MKVGLALTVTNQMVKQSSDTIIGVYDTVQVSTIAVVVVPCSHCQISTLQPLSDYQ